MQRASPQSLARCSTIWKSALLFLLFEQSDYKVKGNFVYGSVQSVHTLFLIIQKYNIAEYKQQTKLQ